MSRAGGIDARALAAAALVIAYALLAHWFSTAQQIGVIALPLAFAPLLLLLATRPRWRIAALAAALAIGVAVWFEPLRRIVAANLAWLYFLQDSALNVGLALLFGRTLLRGRVPLCTQLAVLLQPQPRQLLLDYTRAVTVAWTLFFIAMVAVSAVLFAYADRASWSTFANLLYWPLLLTMFAAEYAVRLCVLPRDQRAGLLATVRAFAAFRPLASR